MSLKLFQDVILTREVPEHGLCAGDVGVVVERHLATSREDGYSVEFFDMTGQTVAVIAVPGSQLRQPAPSDRPSVRVLSHAQLTSPG